MLDRMRFGTALAQFRCYDRPEIIHPSSDCLVRNCNSALREQILDVSKAEREPEIEPDCLVNDLRREPISGVADFRHALRLPSRRRRDNAVGSHVDGWRGAAALAQLGQLDEAHSVVKAGLALNPAYTVSAAEPPGPRRATTRRIWPSLNPFSMACARPGFRNNDRDPPLFPVQQEEIT